MKLKMEDLRCDFCSEPGLVPIAYYGCRDFPVGITAGVTVQSLGDWYVCRQCDELIRTQKTDELKRRMLTTYEAQCGLDDTQRELLNRELAKTITRFMAHRTGERVEVARQ